MQSNTIPLDLFVVGSLGLEMQVPAATWNVAELDQIVYKAGANLAV